MKAIGFNEHYGLRTAVLELIKTMTSRAEKGLENLEEGNFSFNKANGEIHLYGEKGTIIETIKTRYKIGEIVAIRQAYKEIADNPYFINQLSANGKSVSGMKYEQGWNNKMFVASYLMPHHIRITDIKIKRLQDISVEDLEKEGVEVRRYEKSGNEYVFYHPNPYRNGNWGYVHYYSLQAAGRAFFDSICGKGIWDKNPYVVAYSFEKID